MGPPLESPAGLVTRLRDAVNELRGILAPRALWTGKEPPRAVGASLDTLLGIADELEDWVTLRTRELVIADEASREGDRYTRLIIDSIPGLVALLSAAGAVQFVNRQILDYTGRTLDELRQWRTNDGPGATFAFSIPCGAAITVAADTPANQASN